MLSWYIYMFTNQTLKSCLIEFLASTSFKSKEFKDIRKMFVEVYPEFMEKKFYQKIYQAFREVQEQGLVLVDNSTCTYKYTSIYQELGSIATLKQLSEMNSVKVQMQDEYIRLQGEAEKIKIEMKILMKYKQLYPVILDQILRCSLEQATYLKTIESEISILKKLLHA